MSSVSDADSHVSQRNENLRLRSEQAMGARHRRAPLNRSDDRPIVFHPAAVTLWPVFHRGSFGTGGFPSSAQMRISPIFWTHTVSNSGLPSKGCWQ
jgi:hypothetical protein